MMIRLGCTIALTVLVSMVAGAPAASAAEGRIIGGAKVAPDTFSSTYSSVVSVRSVVHWSPRPGRPAPDIATHLCGGTVIAPRLVLTAAHCVTGILPLVNGPGLSVLAGRAELSRRASSPGTKVTAIYVHPGFEGNRGDFSFLFGPNSNAPGFDIAVLRLAAPIDGVTPTPIVGAGEDGAWGAGEGRPTGAIALGWGFTRAPGNRSTRNGAVHSVGLAIRSDRRCERSDNGLGSDATFFDRASMLCAGTVDGPGTGSAKAACIGDSGGPLLAPAVDGSLRVVGVTSWTSNSRPCKVWSVFARVAAVRGWIASIPADEGGANGLLAPRDVTASDAGTEGLRVSWSASPSANVTRYRISRGADGAARIFGPGGLRFLLEAATTDAAARTVLLDGVEPQRRGQKERRTIRVDVEDAAGNRVAGRVLSVAAPTDVRAPSSPGMPRFLERRGKRGESLLVRAAKDDDCVSGYGVQVQTEGGWRGIGTWTNQGCETLLNGSPFGWWGGSLQVSRQIVLPLRQLEAGRHRVRVIAFDRAGNGVASPALVLSLDAQVRGVRRGSCLRASPRFCPPGRFGAYGSPSSSSGIVFIG